MNQVIRTAVPLDGQPLIIAANPRTGHNISGCRWGGTFPYFVSFASAQFSLPTV